MDSLTREKLIKAFGGPLTHPLWSMACALNTLDNLTTIPTLDLAVCISHLLKAAGVDDLKAIAAHYYLQPERFLHDYPGAADLHRPAVETILIWCDHCLHYPEVALT